MKNILIIASLYGSKRVLGLAKYLPEFGWSPTIITPPVKWQPTIISSALPEIEGVRIIETEYHSAREPILRAGLSLSRVKSAVVKNMLHFGGAMINYPDSHSGWHRFALRAGREVLRKQCPPCTRALVRYGKDKLLYEDDYCYIVENGNADGYARRVTLLTNDHVQSSLRADRIAMSRLSSFMTDWLEMSPDQFILRKTMNTYPYHLHVHAYVLPETGVEVPKSISTSWETAMSAGEFSAIMSICPITSHIVASELKQEYPELKWICDLPDLWSQNHNYAYGEWRRRLDTRLELRTLAGADVLTTSSEPRAEQLRALHTGKKVVAITLGYDEKEYGTGDVPLTEKFTITYTGLIYPKRQNPYTLLEAVYDLDRKGSIDLDDIDIRIYGDYLDITKTDDVILWWVALQQRGKVSHTEAIKAQKESQLLWLLDWDDPNELGVHPGKVFEYLGARRPILATGGVKGNVVDKLLKETGAGYHAVSVEETEQVLLKCYREWKETGRVGYHGKGNERYTQREMARKYVELLDD